MHGKIWIPSRRYEDEDEEEDGEEDGNDTDVGELPAALNIPVIIPVQSIIEAASTNIVIPAPEPHDIEDITEASASLPYGGDVQAAMRDQNRDAIRKIFAAREAKAAGGTYQKALAAGGCGHEFNFQTLEPVDTGRPGAPVNDRQVNFGHV